MTPTLVFIHGSWHTASCFDKLTTHLQTTHHLPSVSVSLPSNSGDPNLGIDADISAARAAITAETNRGRDVIVVVHSFGGVVGCSAIKGLAGRPRSDTIPGSTTDQGEEGKEGHVIGLIAITTGFPLTGVAFMAPLLGLPLPFFRINHTTGFADLTASPYSLFYHDITPRSEADYWVSQLRPQSLKALYEGGEYVYAGWREMTGGRVWYVSGGDDRAMPPVGQRVVVGLARGMGVGVEFREIGGAGHSVFLSRVEETAGVVVEAVEAFTGREVGEFGGTVVVGGVRWVRPWSWVKYGLPMGFGWVVGRGLLGWEWLRGLWR
ncbi:Alpha/beta hydrolase family-domain-containing protein [Dichotomopilus funicola]|uniref:Alpha/beta hydrolase family-domain-containing protein n=1 Tax=Dichotomopilus funicola TaxID=1934379 RepID=A0AAN6ZHV8_9PEZI|nr:Alpha/beta hydrolase family-domain-containing protein [Dichotomopilus funicola]